MRLAISNIAWEGKHDREVFQIMRQNEFTGLEIAPTRIFPKDPYSHGEEARQWSQRLRETEGLVVPSMQSIWFGRTEKIFGSEQEREALIKYTKRAIDFADQIKCKNLVFGCPRNRVLLGNGALGAVSFFRELSEYAKDHHAVIAMEANPPIYHTNYINTTMEAIRLVEEVGLEAFRLNLDLGAMIENGESVDLLKGKVSLISHVHISEPGLQAMKERQEHLELSNLLKEEGYGGFVSVEMSRREGLEDIRWACGHVREVFG